MDHRDIIVVTGPPGAGKSTVARALANEFDPCVLLDGDSFFASIHTGWLPPWTEEANEQNLTVIRAIGAAAGEYARSGYTVVVDGIVGPWFLGEFVESVHHPVSYIVLRPSKEVAFRRASNRQAPALTEAEPVSLMYDAFLNLAEFEGAVIDSTALTLDETVGAVLSHVSTTKSIPRSPGIALPAAGALFRDERGNYLIVEPTYKSHWEIPGGAGLPGETPLETCQREVSEELGLNREIGKLLCVDYVKPPAARWEGFRFVFDGGVLSVADIASVSLPSDELVGFEFVDAQELARRVSPPLKRRLGVVLSDNVPPRSIIYLEDGAPPVP